MHAKTHLRIMSRVQTRIATNEPKVHILNCADQGLFIACARFFHGSNIIAFLAGYPDVGAAGIPHRVMPIASRAIGISVAG
jgi:hypothetical protein